MPSPIGYCENRLVHLTWTEVDGVLRCGRYRIHSRPGEPEYPWRLDQLASDPHHTVGLPIAESVRHHSFAAAQRDALATEETRSRTLRALIHTLTAVTSVCVFLFVAGSPLDSLAGVATALAALGIGLRAAGNAVAVKRQDIWGSQPADHVAQPPSLLARLCDAVIVRTVPAATEPSPHGAVRTLPPV